MRSAPVILLAACCWAGSMAAQEAPRFEDEGARARQIPKTFDQEAAREGERRIIAFLIGAQNPDGSFASGAIEGVLDSGYSVASFYDWQHATHSLVLMALAGTDPTEASERAFGRAMDWFLKSRLPRRGSDWDNDTVWAALYGVVASIRLIQDPRFAEATWRERLEARGRELLEILVRNQVPTGGWGYYDDPPYSRRPKWGASFSTALVIPALKDAEKLGWLEDPNVRQRAFRYVRRCALPNGAYEYDLNPIPRAPAGEHINKVKGSLGRIQVCNWARFHCDDPGVTAETVRVGLGHLLEHHRFLDIARMRPIPHEAYYANAGYFYFFGHYYAAQVINVLPEVEREAWHAKLRPHVLKTQRKNGSMCDFLGQRYMVVASTALAALTLQEGM